MGMISCFLFPLFSSGLDLRFAPVRNFVDGIFSKNLREISSTWWKDWEKGTLPSTWEQEEGDPGYCVQRGTSSGNISCAWNRPQEGLKDFSDIVTQRRWNRPYILNLLWLIICLKTTTKIIQRILIGPRLLQHNVQNVQYPKLLGLQRNSKMWSILKGKTINRCQPRWTRC